MRFKKWIIPTICVCWDILKHTNVSIWHSFFGLQPSCCQLPCTYITCSRLIFHHCPLNWVASVQLVLTVFLTPLSDLSYDLPLGHLLSREFQFRTLFVRRPFFFRSPPTAISSFLISTDLQLTEQSSRDLFYFLPNMALSVLLTPYILCTIEQYLLEIYER